MPIKTLALSALAATLLASPLSAQTSATLPPFHAPPGTTEFAVKGRFAGTLRLTSDTLYVHVDSGAVRSDVLAESIRLGAELAILQDGQWYPLDSSTSRPVAWAKSEWVPLAGPTDFAIPLPPHFDPARTWLLFRFTIRREGLEGTTYAHASTMLNGAPRTVGPGL